MIPLIVLSISITFFMIRLAPGDPILYLLSDPEAPAGYAKELRAAHGLDKPLHVQFILYIKNIVTGNLGYSFFYNLPVERLIFSKIAATLLLTVTSFFISLIFGVVFGIIASKNPYSTSDNVVTTSSMIVWAMPSFWVAMVLIIIFSVKFDLFPIGGMYTPGGNRGIIDVLYHLVLPAISLGIGGLAGYTRMTRANMLEELDKDYIIFAWSKGCSERTVYFRHAFRNALLPIVTSLGLRLRGLFTGAALTEIVFGWPGIGSLINESIFRRDYYLISAIFIMISLLTMVGTLISDIAYAYVDPRIRFEK